MGVGWIDNIYNNTQTTWYIKSIDDHHNGVISNGSTDFTLDNGQYHPLQKDSHYSAKWCGIPWYFEGTHYKVISQNQKSGVLFYTTEREGRNWIRYEEINETGRPTGRLVALQSVPKDSDFHCKLRFEASGIFIDVINNNELTAENVLYKIMTKAETWVEATAPIIAAKIQASAS